MDSGSGLHACPPTYHRDCYTDKTMAGSMDMIDIQNGQINHYGRKCVPFQVVDDQCVKHDAQVDFEAVSYTHLTLPTICSV
eukprot:7349242-Alexandrium_andersonii.AAC.1